MSWASSGSSKNLALSIANEFVLFGLGFRSLFMLETGAEGLRGSGV